MAMRRLLLALYSVLAVCYQPTLSQVSTEDKPACRGVFDFLFVIDGYIHVHNVLRFACTNNISHFGYNIIVIEGNAL